MGDVINSMIPDEMQEIKEQENIRSITMNPFFPGDAFNRQDRRAKHGLSVADLLVYLKKIDSLLSWEFVLSECLEHGVNEVGTITDWHFLEKGYQAVSFVDTGVKHIDLNPHLDREAVARQIREIHGIDIEPDEIYYFIWFHEIGHFMNRKASVGFLFKRTFII